ncbi:hypothetical protein SAMN05444920_12882 [Nonomuraea solani]|uniref:Uncharacterized protein n=1 Tax=Nonomuraea solani TaxID=1144553 RepID=A0A1H6F0L9_9ACTN|nr:hypothetical protein [Nonomuraea solani]SEH02655.1 hypothetical protein SAMN05444920_12882 [Nonomuraea solani]
MKLARMFIAALALTGMAWSVNMATANAATGSLILHFPDGPDAAIPNPKAGCISPEPVFTSITNRTDVSVAVFQEPGCTGTVVRVVRPGAGPVDIGQGRSVRVPS